MALLHGASSKFHRLLRSKLRAHAEHHQDSVDELRSRAERPENFEEHCAPVRSTRKIPSTCRSKPRSRAEHPEKSSTFRSKLRSRAEHPERFP